MKQQRNSRTEIFLPLLIVMALCGGILIGLSLGNFQAPVTIVQKSSNTFEQVLNLLHEDYVDSVDTQKLTEKAIKSALEELDPHTNFIPAQDQEMAHAHLEGDFEGVGIEFNVIHDTLYVISPIEGGPSKKAGVMAGDKIVEVDGKNIAGPSLDMRNIFHLLRGPKGSKVKVGVARQGIAEVIHFDIVRDRIPSHSVESAIMLDDVTGYIKVTRFASNTYEEFYQALHNLNEKGMEQLVLDLRDNGGGYMNVAINMVDELLERGKMIVYTDGKSDKYDEKHHAFRHGIFEDKPLIILINEHSASASEILSGALQDNDRALLVGRRSFGKGLVQIPIQLKDGSEVRMTISRYYTPSGRSIQKPFNGDREEYKKDYALRLKNGELFFEDSIQVNDSLLYKTALGRPVYGGGGIIPDVFVAKDTSFHSGFLQELLKEKMLQRYAIEFANNNRKRLENLTLKEYAAFFELPSKSFDSFVSKAEQEGIQGSSEEVLTSANYIKTELKALIARQIWGQDGYTHVNNQQDQMVLKALNLFNEKNEPILTMEREKKKEMAAQ